MHTSRCSISALGDIMIRNRPDSSDVAAVKALLSPYDLTIGNVDLVVSELGTPTPKLMNLSGPRELAQDFKAMGIDVVSMANNHAMDFRAEGMLDSCRAFDEAGLVHAGAGKNLRSASAPAFITIDQRSIAFLSVSCTLPPESAAGPDWPGIAPLPVHQALMYEPSIMLEQPGSISEVRTWVDEGALSRVCNDIANAREKADIVIVALHCGVPAPWRSPSHPMHQMYEQPVCRALVDAGADAVLGTHAHELHAIEFYRGRPIAYCLGNFWIDALKDFGWMEREAVLLELEFSAKTSAPSVAIKTLRMDDDGVPRLDASGKAAELIFQRSRNIRIDMTDRSTFRLTPSD